MDTQRRQHRLWTMVLAAGILAPVLILCFIAPSVSDSLNQYHFLRFPAGFYLLAQGAFLIFVALIFWIDLRQEDVDRKLGASEDR